MRCIQFKAWDNVNGRFIADYTKILPAHYNGSKYPDMGGVDHNVVYVQTGEYETDCELLLFTGHKDKCGKEIYESDIVTIGDIRYIVKWSNSGFALDQITVIPNPFRDLRVLPSLHMHLDETVVVGNIFENPELLEV